MVSQLNQPYSDSLFVTEIVWFSGREKLDYCTIHALLQQGQDIRPAKQMVVKLELLKAFTAYKWATYEQLSFGDWYIMHCRIATELGMRCRPVVIIWKTLPGY